MRLCRQSKRSFSPNRFEPLTCCSFSLPSRSYLVDSRQSVSNIEEKQELKSLRQAAEKKFADVWKDEDDAVWESYL
jgi:hypothetical protein